MKIQKIISALTIAITCAATFLAGWSMGYRQGFQDDRVMWSDTSVPVAGVSAPTSVTDGTLVATDNSQATTILR